VYDATNYSVCPASFTGLGISGRIVTATSSTITYVTTTDTNGYYSFGVRSPSTYTIDIDPGSEFVSAPKLTCQSSTSTFTSTGQATTRTFGYLRSYGGWFQALNGSVYGALGIGDEIPGTMPVAQRHLILADASGSDGLAYFKSGTLNLGTYPGVTVSESGINANTGYGGDDPDYTYFKAKMGFFSKTPWDGLGTPTYNGGANNFEIYTHTGDINFNITPSIGERVIYLIDGDVTVTGNITVPTTGSSFMAVFASGSITINTNVTRVDGWWVGRSLSIPCVDTSPADSICDETDVQFEGQGSFIGYDSISLSRDQGVTNNSQPAESFVYRPDLVINAPDPILVSKYIWRYK
jgi:hypothetical protein